MSTDRAYRAAFRRKIGWNPDGQLACPSSRWKVGFDGNVDIYSLRYTFTHEIGHAIGLDHPGKSGSVMAFSYEERVQQLTPSDISAVQKLYGSRKSALRKTTSDR